MTRDDFDGLVRRLEEVSRRNPRLYIARIAGLVTLAYAYLGLILLGSLALCALMVAMVFFVPASIKLAVVGFIAAASLFSAAVRGLWVKLPPPEGHPVTRQQAPRLFALLDDLRAKLLCSPFHQVIVVGNINAGVVQIPRLGVLGWHRNYLLLGLPLMQSLAPDEFKAVLAHEFAHSSRGHGRFGNWLYRVRRSWAQIMAQMVKQRSRWGAIIFKFIQWFWPLFNGHAFVLARANEYEADACAVRLAGADAAANALIRLRVDSALAGERFWPDILNRANKDEVPPQNVMLLLNDTFKHGPGADDAALWLRQAFLIETNNADTHPSLKDRLRAMGRLTVDIEQGTFPTAPPAVPPQSAAEYYLGDFAADLARQISDKWRESVAIQWAARHEHAQKIALELTELEQRAPTRLNAAQLWQKAQKLIEIRGIAEALPILEQIIAIEPAHANANFVLGRHYLQKDDPQGVQFLEKALASEAAASQNGFNLLYAYYNRTGQRDQLRALEKRADQFQKISAAARLERAQIRATDTFIAPGLTDMQAALLQKIFDSEPELTRMAIARKQVQFLPGSPCFVIALEPKGAWGKLLKSSANAQLVHRVLKQAPLPGHRLVFERKGKLAALAARIFSTPGAVLYTK